MSIGVLEWCPNCALNRCRTLRFVSCTSEPSAARPTSGRQPCPACRNLFAQMAAPSWTAAPKSSRFKLLQGSRVGAITCQCGPSITFLGPSSSCLTPGSQTNTGLHEGHDPRDPPRPPPPAAAAASGGSSGDDLAPQQRRRKNKNHKKKRSRKDKKHKKSKDKKGKKTKRDKKTKGRSATSSSDFNEIEGSVVNPATARGTKRKNIGEGHDASEAGGGSSSGAGLLMITDGTVDGGRRVLGRLDDHQSGDSSPREVFLTPQSSEDECPEDDTRDEADSDTVEYEHDRAHGALVALVVSHFGPAASSSASHVTPSHPDAGAASPAPSPESSSVRGLRRLHARFNLSLRAESAAGSSMDLDESDE